MSVEIVFDHFAEVESAIAEAVGQAVQNAALEVGVLAERFVPVDTGALKATIEVNDTGELSAEVTAGDGLDPNYGYFQEFGTVHMAAQPFMTPAADEGSAVLERLVGEAVKRVTS